MRVYRADPTGAVPVECETPGWPNVDADGNTMFENTHFADEEDAWRKVLREARAGVILATRAVTETRASLATREKHLVEAAIELEAAERNFEAWRERRDERAHG